jgi:hypothetical protein
MAVVALADVQLMANLAPERTAGSHALAAAAQQERWTDEHASGGPP